MLLRASPDKKPGFEMKVTRGLSHRLRNVGMVQEALLTMDPDLNSQYLSESVSNRKYP